MARLHRRQVSLDPIAIAEELGVPRPRDPRPIQGGSDTAIWRIETDEGPAGVRVFRRSQDRVASREREALALVGVTDVPVPAVRAAGAPVSARGRPVTVLAWCEGTTILDRLLAQPSDAGWLGDLLGRTQAAIHRLAPPVGWDRAPTDRLLHFDLHPANVMVAGREISGVLDWVNATAGDPRRDVARTYSMLVADPRSVALRQERPHVVHAFRRAWSRGYVEAAGPLVELGAFIGEAGTFMGLDLGRRLDRRQLAAIERWTERWHKRATPSRP